MTRYNIKQPLTSWLGRKWMIYVMTAGWMREIPSIHYICHYAFQLTYWVGVICMTSASPVSAYSLHWGAYLVRGPKRELLLLVTYLRGATLPLPEVESSTGSPSPFPFPTTWCGWDPYDGHVESSQAHSWYTCLVPWLSYTSLIVSTFSPFSLDPSSTFKCPIIVNLGVTLGTHHAD